MNLMFVKAAPMIFVCLWATGFIGARLGMPHSEPGTFLSLRFALAFALLTALCLALRAPWPGTGSALRAIGIGVLMHGMYLGAVFWVIEHGMPAGISAVVVGLQPLITALIAGWWLKEDISRWHWLGLALGILGVVLVLYPGLDFSDSGITAATIAIAFIGTLSVSVATVLQKRFGADTDLRTGTALQYCGGFIPVFLLALFTESGSIEWNGEMILAISWSIIILSFFAIFLLMWLIERGTVAKVSSLMFLVPAVAALMAYFLFDETLQPIQLLGMGLCALAVALASLIKKPVRAQI